MYSSPPSDKIHIMIIEDDAIYRESIADLINDSETLICDHACVSCEEAFEILDKQDAPQVILLDIQLPGISGIEGISKIKAISPSTQIIMLTVFDDDDKVFNAICQGANGYLLKTSGGEEIQKAVMQVVCGGAVMSPAIAAKILKMFSEYNQPNKDYGLTEREKEILKLLVEGKNKKQTASELNISQYTLDTHLKNIYAKLHVHSQIDLISKTLKEHLL
ncbi:MAG TPA: response regulator transcription factor [Caldithrix abyssi]|uniref:Response regulator transcription factor n=1 Tax=Caldithrix abyssi TaxID=187145 RepID=A0A7V4TZI4_CALAY|nr:response regulator transcription factor [Caldithrix abyssi]